MKIDSITLKNFRNYNSLHIDISDNLNVIVGKNAQGKTNLLESIFLCTIGRSPRTARDRDMIMWDRDYARVTIRLHRKVGKKSIDMYLFNNQNKAIKIDDIGIKKIGQLFGTINAIYFSPDELKLIKDSPDERRKFMDIDLCQFDRNYYFALSNYNKVLMQRNKLLKNPDEKVIHETISIWDEKLAEYGSHIIMSRLTLIDTLKNFASSIHSKLTSGKEKLELDYQGYTAGSVGALKSLLLNKLTESVEKDIHLGYTTVGPHRDDIRIVSNGIDLRSFGSQGQQRTAALSLKLAELDVFRSNTGEYPILLLDDVLSELDMDRQRSLLHFIEPIQTFITCTDFDFDIPHATFTVSAGNININ